jgi:hypothetical protein
MPLLLPLPQGKSPQYPLDRRLGSGVKYSGLYIFIKKKMDSLKLLYL